MITIEKLKVFRKFKGDIDNFSRFGTKSQKTLLNDNDWSSIARIVFDLSLLQKGVVSSELRAKIEEELKNECENEETVKFLKQLSFE